MGKHKFALPEQIRLPEMLAVANWEFKKAAQQFSEATGGVDLQDVLHAARDRLVSCF